MGWGYDNIHQFLFLLLPQIYLHFTFSHQTLSIVIVEILQLTEIVLRVLLSSVAVDIG